MIKRNKKGVSEVIVIVMIIALVMVITLVVWTVVRNLVKGKLEEVESCFNIFGKVSINNRYTCYDSTAKDLRFSISIGEISVDEILVSISSTEGISKSFKISNEEKTIDNLKNYPSLTTNIKLPEKNSGLTYIFDMNGAGFIGAPDLIQLAPIINKKQCDVSDSLNEIDDCEVLA